MNVAVIGTGYVGLVTGAALASVGHHVVCVGRDVKKIKAINSGKSPFFESGLDALLARQRKMKRLRASDEFTKSVQQSDVIIIAVGTPTVQNAIDLTAIREASKQIGVALKGSTKYRLIIVKSTVLPGVTEKIVKPAIGPFGLAMSPEFLREGNAVGDALEPDRIVIGVNDKKSASMAQKLYAKFDCPKVVVNIATAEMTKYAANALFATMISFANEIANISQATEEIDVVDVWRGVHLDRRIKGSGMLSYMYSGCGYGGSCFPKDTKALKKFALDIGIKPDILQSVIETNESQPYRLVKLLKQELGNLSKKRIAVLGLTFKPNTDDTRESPSFPVIAELKKAGASVISHDPMIKNTATIQEVLKNADAAIVVTAWDEYKQLAATTFKKLMKSPVVIDGRRIYNKKQFTDAGIVYKGIGV